MIVDLVLIAATLVFRGLGALGVRRFASWPVSAAHGMAVMLVMTASAHFVPASVTVMPNHADMVRIVPPFLPYADALVYLTGVLELLGALGLVLNAIVLWNTRYIGLALDELRTAGLLIQPEDVERLSPLVHHHIHLDGRYSFSLPEPLAHGQLRSLRDPNDPAEQVFDLVATSA